MSTQPTGTIIEVDPTLLTIATNVRTTVTVEKDFVASVREHGILQPPMITTNDTDGYDVVFGQRRVLAAIEAGLTTIPGYLVDRKEATTARLIAQLTENDQRDQLTAAERVCGYKQLALEGLSINVIAKKTGTKRLIVEKALQVADSPGALAALDSLQLTLDQAAIILEFDDDPDDVSALTEQASGDPAQLEHLASRLRRTRAERAALAEACTMIETAGLHVVDSEPVYDDPKVRRLYRLFTSEKRMRLITPADHESCPGRAAYPVANWDWDSKVFAASFEEVCTDWETNGHYSHTASAGSSGGPLSDEEKAARKVARDNNKLWAAATEVRTQFIQELLQRKELPAGWELAVARFIAGDGLGGMDYRIRSTVEDLFGVGQGQSLKQALDENPNRAGQLALAAALGNVEGSLEYGRSGWKNEHATPRHLRQLSAWGYTLSELEETLTQKATN